MDLYWREIFQREDVDESLFGAELSNVIRGLGARRVLMLLSERLSFMVEDQEAAREKAFAAKLDARLTAFLEEDGADIDANEPQPVPLRTDETPVWDLVIDDMRERDRIGREKYGTPLQATNGRLHLFDAYQEVLDLAVYIRAEIETRRRNNDE